MIFELLLVLLEQTVEPPRTVNDIVLGETKDFATKGPARVCIGRTAIDLIEGETAYLKYAGNHQGALQIVGGYGRFDVTKGDNWRVRGRGTWLTYFQGRDVRWFRVADGIRYLITAKADSEGISGPSAWLEGRAITGTSRDLGVIERVSISEGDPLGCARRYDYGWDFILGDDEEKK